MRLHSRIISCSLINQGTFSVRLQLDSRVDGEASSRNHRRRELLSALREACTPRGSRTQPAGKEGEGVGQSEGEGEAMETDGPVSQPEVHYIIQRVSTLCRDCLV